MEKPCLLCKGIGWLRQELDVFDEGFGRLVRCECNPEDDLILEEKELQEPDPEQLDLGWQKWTD